MKRFLSTLFITAAAVTMFAGCGGSSKSKKKDCAPCSKSTQTHESTTRKIDIEKESYEV